MAEINAVYIFSDRVFGNIDAVKVLDILTDYRHRLFIDIRGNGCGNIFLVAVGGEGKPDCQNFQNLVFFKPFTRRKFDRPIFRFRVCTHTIFIRTAQIFDNILRRCRLFLIFQIADIRSAIHIRQKTKQRVVTHIKLIVSGMIQIDIEVTDHFIPAFFYHADHLMDGFVDIPVFCPAGLINVLNRHGICQFIVGEKPAVSVIDIAPRCRNGTLLTNGKLKVFQIRSAVYDLQGEKPVDQNPAADKNGKDQHKFPGKDHIQYFIFYSVKQSLLRSCYHPHSAVYNNTAE